MTLERVKKETARIRRAGLRVLCIHIPEKTLKKLWIKLKRDDLGLKQVVLAMIETYLSGGFKIEKEKKQKG